MKKLLFIIFLLISLIIVNPIKADSPARLVSDYWSGTNSSYPRFLIEYKDQLYFSASSLTYANELFRSDSNSIELVYDANLFGNGFPYELTKSGKYLYFSAQDGTITGNACQENFELNFELYKTDGITTNKISEINPFRGSCPQHLVDVNGILFFTANDGERGYELYKSDGFNTKLVKDIWPGINNGFPFYLTNLNGILYFTANDGEHGWELWRSDGTTSGTYMVSDIRLGPLDSSARHLVKLGNQLLFFAYQAGIGAELWGYSETGIGVKLIKDITPGENWFQNGQIIVAGNLAYFYDYDNRGYELWVTDGTTNGTHIVRDICPGSCGGISNYAANGTKLYFSAYVNNYAELFVTDGTEEGTRQLTTANANPTDLSGIQGLTYFAGMNSYGIEPWVSSGMSRGTYMLQDINPGSVGSNPKEFTRAGNHIFFRATDADHGAELWVMDCCSVTND